VESENASVFRARIFRDFRNGRIDRRDARFGSARSAAARHIFVVAHFHYVLIGGAVFPLFGAVYYWFPKWTGRLLHETAGKINFWLLFIGFNMVFFPMHQLGLQGMPRRVYTYLPETGWSDLNFLATIGAFLMGIAVLTFVGNVFYSLKYCLHAGDNPWGADTLEWATSSPPPAYNFQYIPVVQGRHAIWNRTENAAVVTGLDLKKREVLATTIHDAAPDNKYELQGDSIYPFLLAVVTGATFTSVIFHPWAIPVGFVLSALVLFGWFWSNSIAHRAATEKDFEKDEENPEPSLKPLEAKV
jgi:cytochrome c oxidase subunit 1